MCYLFSLKKKRTLFGFGTDFNLKRNQLIALHKLEDFFMHMLWRGVRLRGELGFNTLHVTALQAYLSSL